MYTCELNTCPDCGGPLQVAYTSGVKTVQTMEGVLRIAHQPRYCLEPRCPRHHAVCPSAQWQQCAPRYCIYGYDVIAQIGWLRQTHQERFVAIHNILQAQVKICESEVRQLYHERYLPLLACHERQSLEQLHTLAGHSGLILSLDGLAPEGGEPQLWVVREVQLGLTLRSGWLSQQDQDTFANFLQPIAELELPVVAVLSDKQRGLVPAVALVFPAAKHGFCQAHYLNNIAAPVAEEDQALKVLLRQRVRNEVGKLIRQEKSTQAGVLTVTGLLPTPLEESPALPDAVPSAQPGPAPVEPEHAAIVEDLRRRVRYLLTLKGRPPFRLAGVEMFVRLTEVKTCLDTLLAHRLDADLLELRRGLHVALNASHPDYVELQQAADWLVHIAEVLDPADKPARSATQVQQAVEAYLDDLDRQNQDAPRLQRFCQQIRKTTRNYTPGLFQCYDLPGLPRTNNARESEFRDINRRLLSTTGQQGLVKRLLQREGAWELIPHPDSLHDTIEALSHIDADDFREERQRVRNHRARFRLHTRSAKQAQKQLDQLEQRWKALPPTDSS
jgi:hypothetical protein